MVIESKFKIGDIVKRVKNLDSFNEEIEQKLILFNLTIKDIYFKIYKIEITQYGGGIYLDAYNRKTDIYLSHVSSWDPAYFELDLKEVDVDEYSKIKKDKYI